MLAAAKPPWPSQLLLAVFVVALFTGWAMHQHWVKPKQEQLQSVEQLMDQAIAAHAGHLERYVAHEINQKALADGIERGSLPKWDEALRMAEGLRAAGVEGELLDQITEYLRLRRDASEQFLKAIRADDGELYEQGKHTWQQANEALERLKPTERPATTDE